MTTKHVCMNAWFTLDNGDVTYSDTVNDPVEGWGVYLRIDDERGEQFPFDTEAEQDFISREAALAYANTLAAKHGCDVREY